MIDISKLLENGPEEDSIRYSKECHGAKHGVRKGMGPVVVWNITNKCNFRCKHCYSNSFELNKNRELTTDEAKKVINDLASINTPVILLSGGEPLMRDDIFELIEYIKQKGINVSLSSNGSLITKDIAKKLKELGIGYIGVSLDGTKAVNDKFRGIDGAYDKTINAIKNCQEVNQKVGLRFTLQKENVNEVPKILNLLDEMDIPRICFYHLVPSGRGQEISNNMLSKEEIRCVVDTLYKYVTDKKLKNEIDKEVLTVANYTDGIYLYLKEKQINPQRAENIIKLLTYNGGNRSGSGIVNIKSNGDVHPDQFHKSIVLGNVLEKSFTDIWYDQKGTLEELRNRKGKLKGRCRKCKWIDICNGNLRARAHGYYNDVWAEDPSCCLYDEEI